MNIEKIDLLRYEWECPLEPCGKTIRSANLNQVKGWAKQHLIAKHEGCDIEFDKDRITEVETEGYKYVCEECGKKIVSLNEKQVNNWARQHELSHK